MPPEPVISQSVNWKMMIVSIKRFLPLLLLMLVFNGFFSSLDVVGKDWVTRVLAPYRNPDPDIVLITIDDESLGNLQAEWGSWPWDRSLHGFLLEEVELAGAKVIGYDILFSQPDIYRPDGDLYFNEVLHQNNNVIMAASKLEKRSALTGVLVAELAPLLDLTETAKSDPSARVSMDLPWAIEQSNWQLGAVNFLMGEDGIGREYPRFVELSGWYLPTLAQKIIQVTTDEQTPVSSGSFGFNWRSSALNPYVTYSYSQLYQWFEQGDSASFRQAFNDKWVLVGATASGLFDARPTAIAPFQPGLILHATALDNLKNNNGYQHSNWPWLLLAMAIVLLLLSPGYSKASFKHQVVLSLILWLIVGVTVVSVALSLAFWSFLLVSWFAGYLAFGLILIINLLVSSFGIYRQNLRTLDTFSRFMEPKVVSILTRQKKLEPAALTKRCDISVLFTDIRGFTTLSESRSAEQVIELLNAYFSGQVREIFNHQGTFDKYIGDAVMAFWGAPVEDPNHADNAVRCALAMVQALEQFKLTLGQEGENFDIGIGIHSGPAVVGMLGSSQRYDYTAIGDTVNVASRIEGQTKGRARLLISANTKSLLTEKYDYISHGNIQLRGRSSEVELFEVIMNHEG